MALAFARHLDAKRFDEARRCLAEDCVYEPADSTVIVGAASILASYSGKDANGSRALDELTYTSTLEWVEGNTVSVEFRDDIRHRGKIHTFRSRQLFIVRDGLIERIIGIETRLERQALGAFLASCGVVL